MKSKPITAYTHLTLLYVASLCGACKAHQSETSRSESHAIAMSSPANATDVLGHSETVAARVNASPDCFGQWRFEVGEFAEVAVNPQPGDSWCRRMPRALSVELRRDNDGRPAVTGSPLQPTDVMVGSGACEFQFEGPSTGVPENYTLIVQVPNDAASVGSAKCTAWGRTAEGQRAGWGMTAPAQATLVVTK